MASLKRREDVAVPSWPVALTKTAAPPEDVTPNILPIKQLLSTLLPSTPIQITLLAVVTPWPALAPKAVLLPPVVLFTSALSPMAVLALAVVLLKSAPLPLAVLEFPMVLVASASKPL